MKVYRVAQRDEVIHDLLTQFEDFIENEGLKFPENIVGEWANTALNYGPRGIFIADRRQLLLLPGNGTTSSFQALFLQLSTCPKILDVIVSSRDTQMEKFIDRLKASKTIVASITGDHDDRVKWVGGFDYDTAVLYGSDRTIQRYLDKLSPETTKYLYGSKTSIGIHTDPETLFHHVENYARDAFTYEGNGCLNTSVLYIPQESDVEEFVSQLARKRYELFGNQFPGFQRASDEMMNLVLELDYTPHLNAGILVRTKNTLGLRMGFGNGTLVVRPYSLLDEVYSEWVGSYHLLSSCTFDQLLDTRGVQSLVSELGVTRVTRPGRAQFPSYSWSHDGYGPLPRMWKEVTNEF